MLEKMVRLRSALKPYLQELDRNVSARGVPTMRPLAFEFPRDKACRGINDQYGSVLALGLGLGLCECTVRFSKLPPPSRVYD
jgi:hypothetical protein